MVTTTALAFIIPTLVIGLAVLVACDTQTARRPEEQRVGQMAGQALEDATITSQVRSRLAGDATPGLNEIGVQTDRGVVRLEGIVASETAKQRAQTLAREIGGVRDVVNNLKVQG
jgi:osmotically-inducible protein OsmY